MDQSQIIDLVLKYGVPAVLGLAAAWGAMRMKVVAQNETISRLRVDRIAAEKALDARINGLAKDMAQHKQETTDRLARIETKLDLILGQFNLGGNHESRQ